MSDVFLSYSRDDKERATLFARRLTDAGLTVWWDLEIPPGQTWDQVIGKALDEAKCVVVLWTATSVASDWVKEEAARGKRRGALVPVLLDDVEAPLGFGRIEAAELANWEGDPGDAEFQNFLSALQQRVEKPIEVAPQPSVRSGARRRLLAAGAALALVVPSWILWKSRTSTPVQASGLSTQVGIQIWNVESDHKGALKAASSFTGESAAASAAKWILAQVLPTEEVRPVQLHLVIPVDPTAESIQLEAQPPIELRTFLYISQDRGKSRVPSQLRPEDLAFAGPEFAIEIAATGYDSIPVPVVVGQAQDRSFELKPLPIKLAVEEVTGGQNHIAAQLTELLAAEPGVSALGPDALQRLQQEIKASKDAIQTNRAAQVAIRDSLGVDYIISGSLSTHPE